MSDDSKGLTMAAGAGTVATAATIMSGTVGETGAALVAGVGGGPIACGIASIGSLGGGGMATGAVP